MTQPVVPAPAPPASITVYDPNGALVQISPADLPNAQAQGYVVAEKPAVEKGAYDVARERGFGEVQSRVIQGLSPLLSYEQGTVAGATAGIGEGVQRKIAGLVGPVLARATGGPDMTSKEAEEFYKQIAQGGVHSGIHATGEVAGMVGSAVAGGALKGAAGAAGTVGRGLGLLTEAGEGAAAGARALTGGLAARGALGRAAATGIELGVRGGIEMGAYEGIKELSEEMFGDPPLSAQKIFAAAADGAEGGALFGGALGAGGSLVKSGAKGIANTAIQYASKNAETLQDLANEQRWRALDPLKKFTEQAEARVQGGSKAVGGTLREYGVFDGTLADAAKADVNEVAKRIDNAVEKVGQKLGAITDASPGVVKYGAVDDAIEGIIAPIRKKAGHEGIVRSLESYRESLASKMLPDAETMVTGLSPKDALSRLREADIPIQDALFQRKALDQLVYQESKALDPNLRVGLLRDFRSKFENVIVDAFDDAAKAAGNPSAKAELLKLKGDYQKLTLAQEAAEASSSRMATNRNFSLTDYISGGIASTVGTGVGQAVGGDYGAAIGGLAGGAIGARLNKFGRARGNAIVASIADKVAKFGGKGRALASLEEAVAGAEEVAAAKAAPALLPEGRAPLMLPQGESAGVRAARAEVEALQAERSALEARMGEPQSPRLMAPEPKAPELPARPAEFADMPPAMRAVGEEPKAFGKKPPPKDIGPEPKPIGAEPPAFERPPPEPPKPVEAKVASAAEDTRSFADQANDAIAFLDKKPNGRSRYDGLVPMSEVRKEFPHMSKEEFDAAIIEGMGSGKINPKGVDQPKHLPNDEQRAGLVIFERQGNTPGMKDLYRYGYLAVDDARAAAPWTSRAAGSVSPATALADSSSAAYKSKLQAWESEKLAADRAREEWSIAKMASEAEHAKWRADKAANDAARAEWEAAKSESEGARKSWLKEKQTAEAEHQKALQEWEEKYNSALDAEEAYDAAVNGAKAQHEQAVAQWQTANAEAHAEMLQKAAEFQRAKDAIAKVDEQLEKAAKGLVEPDSKAVREVSTKKPLKERYDEARAATDQIGANLEAVMSRAAVPEGSMPNVHKALGEGVMRAATFLANAGPPPVSQLPTMGSPMPSNTTAVAMQNFLDRYEAVNNPMGVLRKFQAGRVSTAQVQALKVVSPELFAELQKQCLNVVATRQASGKPLPFQARQRMHVLLGILTDPSQDPKLTKLLQSNLNTEDQPQDQAAIPQAPKRPVQLPPTTRTYERLEEG